MSILEGSEESYTAPRDSSSVKSRFIRTTLMLLGALALIGLGAAGVMYGVRTKPELFGIKKDETQVNEAEVEILVKEVGKIIQLPEGETPTLATVTELDKVKDQPFFKNAQNGDKVLIYTNAKRAILYRQSEKKIIEVGVVNIDQQQQVSGQTENIIPIETAAPSASPTLTPRPTLPAATLTPTPTVAAQP